MIGFREASGVQLLRAVVGFRVSIACSPLPHPMTVIYRTLRYDSSYNLHCAAILWAIGFGSLGLNGFG